MRRTRRRTVADIKSNNPHLTGGEQHLVARTILDNLLHVTKVSLGNTIEDKNVNVPSLPPN